MVAFTIVVVFYHIFRIRTSYFGQNRYKVMAAFDIISIFMIDQLPNVVFLIHD